MGMVIGRLEIPHGIYILYISLFLLHIFCWQFSGSFSERKH